MIFTDLRYLLFFLLFGVLFALVRRDWRMDVLAVWGIVFYALYAGWALAIVLILVALVHVSGRIYAMTWIAGLATAGALVYFKLVQVLPANPGSPVQAMNVIVPLGFSYLSFELIHVTIERHRGRIAETTWRDLLGFAFFAPARIAGPIKRLPQFRQTVADARVSGTTIYAGLLRVLGGLAKKFLLADILALRVAEAGASYSMKHAWSVVFAYSLQVYFDFSAYSDIAIGLAQILGIRLPENFNWPYFSRNIREFWDRWHITLSHWVRDYIFLPTGRVLFRTKLRPHPAAIATISYLITFLAVGAWHGLTPGFLIWGCYHGILLTLYQIIRLKVPARVASSRWYSSRLTRAISTAFTFVLVTIGWVPFMLPLAQARKLFSLMFGVSL